MEDEEEEEKAEEDEEDEEEGDESASRRSCTRSIVRNSFANWNNIGRGEGGEKEKKKNEIQRICTFSEGRFWGEPK